jgi:hypothetical protein
LNKSAEGPPAKAAPASSKAGEDPPTDREPRAAVVAPPAAAQALVPPPHAEISTHDEAEPEFAPISLSEPITKSAAFETPKPSLPEPVDRPLPVLKLNLDAVADAPTAPRGSEPGPDLDSLPRIQLVDTPVTSPPPPKHEPDFVGSDLPAISFDANVPLDLGIEPSAPSALELPDDIMPGIKLAEEGLHLGGADDVSLNDLPDVMGSLDSQSSGTPVIRLVDTPLEALAPPKQESAPKPHADVPTIKLVE